MRGLIDDWYHLDIDVETKQIQMNQLATILFSENPMRRNGFDSKIKKMYEKLLIDTIKNSLHRDIINYSSISKKIGKDDLTGMNLINADLKFKDLHNINLDGASLVDTDFSGANLPDANLKNTNLRGVNFSMADLTNADLAHSDLSEVSLLNAILKDTNLKDAIVTKKQLESQRPTEY